MPKSQTPEAIESERAILGAILLDNAAWEQATHLVPTDFYLDSHRRIFAAMHQMFSEQIPVDLVTLAQQLLDQENLAPVGGASYISSLTDGLPKVSNIGHYIAAVQKKAQQRRLISTGLALSAAAQEGDADGIAAAIATAVPAGDNGTAAGAEASKEARILKIPHEAWCDLGRVYLESIGHTTSASENYHYAVFLTVAGAILGRTVHYNYGELFPNFYTALVGESAYSKKGTAMKFGKHLLRDTGSNVLWLMSVDSAQGFIEHMAKHQAKSPSVCGMLHFPEMRALIDKANREGTRDIIPKLAEAYDCEDLQLVVRNNPCHATNTFTSLLGGAAPGWLDNLKVSDVEGGIGNRFMWIPGEEREPLHKRPPKDTPAWTRVVKSLHDMRDHWAAARDPVQFTLSPEADERMEQFGKAVYYDTREEPMVRKLVGRMEGHCIKTAMVYAAIERTNIIGVGHLEKAILFCEFLMKALYLIFADFGMSEVVRQERRIVKLVERAGGVINQRALQRQLKQLDAETFHRRLRWLSGQDGELDTRKEGRSTLIFVNR